MATFWGPEEKEEVPVCKHVTSGYIFLPLDYFTTLFLSRRLISVFSLLFLVQEDTVFNSRKITLVPACVFYFPFCAYPSELQNLKQNVSCCDGSHGFLALLC